MLKILLNAAFACFVVQAAASAADFPSEPTEKAKVHSDIFVWQGVYTLKEGEKCKIVVSGTWKNKGQDTGPMGNTGKPKAEERFIEKGLNEFAVLAKVGKEGSVSQFDDKGGNRAEKVVRGPGTIYLIINDGFPKEKPEYLDRVPDDVYAFWRDKVKKEKSGFSDNEGSLDVQLFVTKE